MNAYRRRDRDASPNVRQIHGDALIPSLGRQEPQGRSTGGASPWRFDEKVHKQGMGRECGHATYGRSNLKSRVGKVRVTEARPHQAALDAERRITHESHGASTDPQVGQVHE